MKFFGADLLDHPARNIHSNNYFKVDQSLSIPVPDGLFNSISAYDFIEHLNRSDGYPNSFIKFMNEASRILEAGGTTWSDTCVSKPSKFSRSNTRKHYYRSYCELFLE